MGGASLSNRLLVCAMATLASAAVAWFAYRQMSPEAPSVLAVDTSAELARLMNERAREDPEPAGHAAGEPYPPALLRTPIDEETAETFFPANAYHHWEYEPHSYSVRAGHLSIRRNFGEHPAGGWTIRTNSLGMREDEEVLARRPDLRILVTGDSHTDGVCANSESFPNLIESALAAAQPGRTIEVLNAAAGGHNLYNYVGTLERFAHLEPDLFVVVVYGGNDFSTAMVMQRYFHRRKSFATGPHSFEPARTSRELRSIGLQELSQEVYFLNNSEDVELAVDLVCSVSVELERMCAEVGAELLLVYLPPPSRGQPEHFRGELTKLLPAAGLERQLLGASDRIANEWLRFLEERGIDYVDLRGHFRANQPLLYWRTDHHLNVAGHQLVAEVLQESARRVLAD
jgi:lysophospholipase L1-like esterase